MIYLLIKLFVLNDGFKKLILFFILALKVPCKNSVLAPMISVFVFTLFNFHFLSFNLSCKGSAGALMELSGTISRSCGHSLVILDDVDTADTATLRYR